IARKDRHIRSKPAERRLEAVQPGIVHQQRLHPVPIVLDDTADDVAAFGHEEPEGAGKLGGAHGPIAGGAPSLGTVNTFGSHYGPFFRSRSTERRSSLGATLTAASAIAYAVATMAAAPTASWCASTRSIVSVAL